MPKLESAISVEANGEKQELIQQGPIEKLFESLLAIENDPNLTIDGKEGKSSQEDEFFKKLSDRQIFDLLFLIGEAHDKAKEARDEEKLRQLWHLYGSGNFVLGKRENSAYYKILELKELEVAKEIENLSPEILEQLNKIQRVGKEYISGSSASWGLEGPKDKEPISLSNLIFVRKTNLAPIIDASPSLLKSRFFVPAPLRLPTLHWTLNGPVSPHAYGSWAESICTIFAPAEATIKKNGPPLVLNETNSFWYKTNINLPKGSVILQEKTKQKEFSVANAIKNRPDFIEKNKPENLIKELDKDYCVLNVEFSDLESWLLLHRAIVQKMGYTYFGCGWWPDPRITELTRSIREQYGINAAMSVEHERDTQYLDEMKYQQTAVLRQNELVQKSKSTIK